MRKIFIHRIAGIGVVAGIFSLYLFHSSPGLFSFAIVALGLGLRHGLDSDHIVAIDNITRKLALEKKDSSATGLYFALGHSTIVFCLTLLVIMGVSHSKELYDSLSSIGDKLGSLVSISFLVFTLFINWLAFKNLSSGKNQQNDYPGLIYKLANRLLFSAIDRPAKMFVVGFFFGLGFDTATEIALLSLAATSLVHGVGIVFILFLPVLFACGMMFTDTVNSIFMTKIYNWVNQSYQDLSFYNYLILAFASLMTLIVTVLEVVSFIKEYYPGFNFMGSILSYLDNNDELFGFSIICGFLILGLMVYLKYIESRRT